MCGIAGVLSFTSDVNGATVKLMTDKMAHRGPNGDGHWVHPDKKLALGHRRLSIIDLSQNGSQPMHYQGKYTITFNGEIYNYLELKNNLIEAGYSFLSESDTEVLLALYAQKGEDMLAELDGMFAFAIWDDENKKLFCARDRVGEKPFHYFADDNQFVFASEIKGIFAAGIEKAVNEHHLINYVYYGTIINKEHLDQTFFKSILRLPPAHMLTVQNGKVKVKRYWSLPESQLSADEISYDEAQKEFQRLLEQSVKLRLRSDVPVGSSLSGGLDSSLVVSLIKKQQQENSPFNTFSARFPGHPKDEGYFINQITSKHNTTKFEVNVTEEKLIEAIVKVLDIQDEPFASTSIIAQNEVMQLANQHNIVVLLDGQGADEILAGYTPYYKSYWLELLKTNRKKLADELKAYNALTGNAITVKRILSIFLWENSVVGSLVRRTKFHLNKLRNGQADSLGIAHDLFNKHIRYKDKNVHSKLNEALADTLTGGEFETLLRYADRNSMAQSREVRLPYTNHELIAFMTKLPSEYKIKGGWTKVIMRDSYEYLLPPEITWRKDKIGFDAPFDKITTNATFVNLFQESVKKLVNLGYLQSGITNRLTQLPAYLKWRYIMAAKTIGE